MEQDAEIPNNATRQVKIDAVTLAAYDHVDSKINRADQMVHGAPMWYGWALREAFIAGAKWQRLSHGNEATTAAPLTQK